MALRWIFDTEADLIFVAGTTAERMGPPAEHGSPYSIIAAPENPNQAGIVILGTSPWTVESFTTDHFGEVVYRITVGSNDEAVDVVTAWGDLGSNSLDADKLAARLATVAEAVASASRPVAVIGNLGATRWTNDMRIMRATLGLRDATEGFGYLATSPVSGVPVIGGWIGIPIDIVLMTEEIMPLELTTGPDIGADHLPVTVVIAPNSRTDLRTDAQAKVLPGVERSTNSLNIVLAVMELRNLIRHDPSFRPHLTIEQCCNHRSARIDPPIGDDHCNDNRSPFGVVN
ncbi:MAG: hypothetical protein V3S38_03945 [Acidimicrobiia bacterium]